MSPVVWCHLLRRRLLHSWWTVTPSGQSGGSSRSVAVAGVSSTSSTGRGMGRRSGAGFPGLKSCHRSFSGISTGPIRTPRVGRQEAPAREGVLLRLHLHPWPPTHPLYHCLPPTRPPLPVPCVLSNAGEVSSCLETEEAELTVSIAFPYLKRQDLPGLLGSPVQHTCLQSTHHDPLPLNTLVLLPLSARSSQRTT